MDLEFLIACNKFKETSFYKKIRKESLTNPKVLVIYSDFTSSLVTERVSCIQDYIKIFKTIISFTDDECDEVQNIFPRIDLSVEDIQYDYERDLVLNVSQRPFESWIFNRNNGRWEAPVPHPITGGPYVWSEETLSWVSI